MSANTGGPAYPVHPDVRMDIDLQWCGMTLRDYFAAKAMQSMNGREDYAYTPADAIALDAYALADAMLKARQE